MKKQHVLFILLMTMFFQVEARKVKGYYLNNTYDTSYVTFEIPIIAPNDVDFRYLHDGVSFWLDNERTQKINPHDAKEIVFTYNKVTYRLISCQDYLNLSKKVVKRSTHFIFLKLEVEGNMRLYSYTYTQHVSMDFDYKASIMVFQRKNDLLFVAKPMGQIRSLKKYFEDCPNVLDKLKKNELEKGDEIEMVKIYNKKCAFRA